MCLFVCGVVFIWLQFGEVCFFFCGVVLFCFLGFEGGIVLGFCHIFLRKNLNLMGRDGERIWKDLGKAVIKIYLDLNCLQ